MTVEDRRVSVGVGDVTQRQAARPFISSQNIITYC